MPRSSPKIPSVLAHRAQRVHLLLMDVDGVLTDGRIYLISAAAAGGAAEMKVFHARDGAGLKLAHRMGLKTGFITGRNTPAVAQRAHELSVDFVFQGQAEKLDAFEEAAHRAGVSASEVAYMGDDLPDLPLLERAGLAVAVANSVPEVKRAAHYVTKARGGEGAAREVVELILKAKGKWRQAIPRALA